MTDRMDPLPELDALLGRWLAETAPAREPEQLLDRVLTRTAVLRPRPAWWPAGSPLDVLDQPRRAMGRGLALALVAAIIVGLLGVALIAGGRPHLPLPLGRNGLLVAGRPGEVVLINEVGSIVGRAPTGQQTGFGVWSPDGTRVAYLSGLIARPDLVIADDHLREQLRIALPPSSIPDLSWSPDGRHMAFPAGDDPGARIYVVDVVAGAVARPITAASLDAAAPRWSPDGELIAIRGGTELARQALYVLDPDGGDLTRLSWKSTAIDACNLAWTPDGHSIVFGTAGGVYTTWIVDRDGANERMLTKGSSQVFCPSVSPDGTRFAVADWLATGRLMTVHPIDGPSAEIQLDGPLWDAWAGVWSPDGRTLAVNGRVLDGGANPLAFEDPRGVKPARIANVEGAQVTDWQRLAP